MKGIIDRIRYNFWTFIVLYLIFCFTHGIQGSYTASMLTSLEKKFHLSSSLSGLLMTIATIGYFVGSPVIPYYFGRKHRVRLFAICMLSTGLCGLLYTVPHFIYGSNDEVVSIDINSSHSETFNKDLSDLCFPKGVNATECHDDVTDMESDIGPNCVAMTFFCISEIMHGLAGVSLWTVGMAFIDDNLSVHLSSKLIGIMFLMRFISPVVAFGLGSVFLSLPSTLKPTLLTPDHPKWLGAWWLGYFACFVVNSVICIPTFFLPEDFRKGDSELKDNNNPSTSQQSTNPQSRRMSIFETNAIELWQKSVRILKNPVFTISSIAVSIDCYIYSFYAFLPKYMEVHFIQVAWMASLLGVKSMIPCIAGGLMSYCGGMISGKFKPGYDQGVSKNVLFSWSMSIVNCLLFVIIMFIPCSQSYFPFGYDQASSMVQLNQSCNSKCACADDLFDPVCGSDNLWHVSPCHAGCSRSYSINGSELFGNCTCTGWEAEATKGMCDQSCFIFLVTYVILSTLLTGINCSYNVPLTNVVLKCVDETDKSLALGIQSVLICTAMFPSTIIYGRLLDSSCILWSTIPCTKSTGSCLAYDHRNFRLILHGFTLACRIFSSICYGLNYYLAVKKAKHLEETHHKKELANVTMEQVFPLQDTISDK